MIMCECVQPIPKSKLSEKLFDTIVDYLGIEDQKKKTELQILVDFYVTAKTRENIIEAFSVPECEKNKL